MPKKRREAEAHRDTEQLKSQDKKEIKSKYN